MRNRDPDQDSAGVPRTRTGRSAWPRLVLAALAIQAVLAMPATSDWSWTSALAVPVGLPVIVLFLVGLGRAAQVVAAPALWLLAVQKSADLVTDRILGRSFGVMADLPLAGAAWDMVAGVAGPLTATGAALGILALAFGVAAALWRACGAWSGLRPRRRAIIPALALSAVAALPVATGTSGPGNLAYALQRIDQARQTLADRRDLTAAIARDPFAGAQGLLDRIDRDVLVVFVESYGRTSLDTPFYAETHRATLRRAQARLSAAGLAMRSGIVAAPTRGGQSWLSHATLASGLWIGDQSRYRALLSSPYAGLFHQARRAGFRIVSQHVV
ncbi:hypothetical protein EYF88_13830 [Paracoccus sediminis]|uniref:Sulfatase n=1 Tax=Paracoccus sediminis TaxID=1214787 RepID=A0A238XM82_9RHOB|nr:hypothetical protein [Paracoccus sediminis]TBN48151.1 hypothetical protein EYF88_13830 [Paracoccus sediminis]SNR59698.1 hypothetical protein SAMN06265378_1111 [Paracoccus sediminis]